MIKIKTKIYVLYMEYYKSNDKYNVKNYSDFHLIRKVNDIKKCVYTYKLPIDIHKCNNQYKLIIPTKIYPPY